VGRQIVHDDDVAFFEGRRELGLDVSLEDAPVHRRVDDEGGGQSVAAQAGDEGLGFPMAERSFGAQALTLWATSAQARHLCGGSGFVEENQPVRFKPHPWLPRACPFFARLLDVGTILFAGHQGFF